jgi:hypothetical protein
MKIKDTFLIVFAIWVLALDRNDRFKYLVFTIFIVWLVLKIIKFGISKKEN